MMAQNCRRPRQTPEGKPEGMRIALLQGEKMLLSLGT